MNWTQISAAILDPTTGYLASIWLNAADPPTALTDIALDNVLYTPVQGHSWLRASLRPIGSRRKVMTGDRNTGICRNGLLFFQVFTPIADASNTTVGDAPAQAFCDILESAFREHKIVVGSEEIVFSDLSRMGQDTDGAWFFQTIQLAFEHYAF